MWVSWPDINFGLTFTSIVLSIEGAPSDERSGLSFVVVIIRPLLVNIYRFTCNVHVSDNTSRYISSGRTPQKTTLPTVLLLLRVQLLLRSRDGYWPSPSRGRLCWFYNSGFQQTCHNNRFASFFSLSLFLLYSLITFTFTLSYVLSLAWAS
jgi:hypothetical protein